MADGILWGLVNNFDPFGSYSRGLQENNRQRTVLEQLAGQQEDRRLRRDEFGYRKGRDTVSDQHWQQTFDAGRADAANANAYRNASIDLQRRQFERGAFPAGYQADPNNPGGMRFIPGGPQDPATLRATTEAQKTPLTPSIKEIELANGTKISVRVNPDGSIEPLNIPGVSDAAPSNPYATGGKISNDQSNAGIFADRMTNAHNIINQYENINEGPGGYTAGALAGRSILGVPLLPNVAMSPERQKVIQAQRDFVNAVLRKESGAAISQSEFDNAMQQYFPQPGDSKEVIAQKRANREAEIRGFYRAAGPTYQLPQNAVQPNRAGLAPGQSTTINGVTVRRLN